MHFSADVLLHLYFHCPMCEKSWILLKGVGSKFKRCFGIYLHNAFLGTKELKLLWRVRILASLVFMITTKCKGVPCT